MKKFILMFAMLCLITNVAIAEKKRQTNYRTALVFAYSQANNVFEDENIRLEIYNETLYATNKTDRTIFLDLSQCFLVHNESSYPLYNKHQDEKVSSKSKISTSIDEFLSLAPAVGSAQNETFICNLAGGIYREYNTSESTSGNFSKYEERLLNIMNELINESLEGDPKGKNYLGTAYRHLTEDESINNIGATLSYAFNKRSDEWTPIAISTWVSDVYFTPFYVEMPKDLSKKEKSGFGIKKTEFAKIHLKADSPFEFENDRSPLTVCDWTGDVKKGTFRLSPVWVSKKKGMSFGKGLLAGLATVATGGAGAALFFTTDLSQINYKSSIIFDGKNEDWGKMTYYQNNDMSKFNNKR